ncbi:sodium/potassium-transporting ATPase subunit beta-1-interacting protein 4 isoform X3 [Macaca mulatta]
MWWCAEPSNRSRPVVCGDFSCRGQMYTVWTAIWVTWNIFIICFYLEVGGLSQDSELLTFSLSQHRSWWHEHWPGCLHEEVPAAGLGDPHGQALVSGAICALEPSSVEALHSGLQILIALLGFVCGCYVVSVFTEEEDSFDFIGGFDPFPLYHVNEKPSSLLSKQAYFPTAQTPLRCQQTSTRR